MAFHPRLAAISIAVSVAASPAAGAQWAKWFNNGGSAAGFDVQQTADGGYIVAGRTGFPHRAWLLKLNSAGDAVWQKSYGGSPSDSIVSVQQTLDGGYIAVGYTYSEEAASYDVWVLKLSATGVIQWQKTCGGARDDFAYSVRQTSDGNYVLAGQVTINGSGHFWVGKLDTDGDLIWQRGYGPGTATSIRESADGSLVVAGLTSYFQLLKLDPSGNLLWRKTYTWIAYSNSYALSLDLTADGGYVMAGQAYSGPGNTNQDAWVVKVDGSGNPVWQKGYGGDTLDVVESIRQTPDAGYILAGYSFTYDRSDSELWVMKLDSGGEFVWQTTSVVGRLNGDERAAIDLTSDGGYVVAGETDAFHAGSDVWVLKLEAGGTISGCAALGRPPVSVRSTPVIVSSYSGTVVETLLVTEPASAPVAVTTAAIGLVCGGPDLVVSALTVPATVKPGTTVRVTSAVKNRGLAAAGPFLMHLHLSADAILDAGDAWLASRSVPSLAIGATSAGSTSVVMPTSVCSGTFYVIAEADGRQAVAESNEGNNTKAAASRAGPDLIVAAVTTPWQTGAGRSVTLTDTTSNVGGCPSVNSLSKWYLSRDNRWDWNDTYLGQRAVPVLLAGASSSGSVTVTMPSTAPTGVAYLVAKADAGNLNPSETDESNNTLARSIRIGPDLTISAISVPSSANRGATITISETTRNIGGGSAGASTTRWYLSVDRTYQSGDFLLGQRGVPELLPGASSARALSLIVPTGIVPRAYFLIAVSDAGRVIVELVETNNQKAGDITIR